MDKDKNLDKSLKIVSKIVYETIKDIKKMQMYPQKNIFEGEFEKYYANYVRNILPFRTIAPLSTKKCLDYLEREFINNCVELYFTQQSKDGKDEYVDVFNYDPLFCSVKLEILREYNFKDEDELLNSNNEEAIAKYNRLLQKREDFIKISKKINKELKNTNLKDYKSPLYEELVFFVPVSSFFILFASFLVYAGYTIYKDLTYYDPNHFTTGNRSIDQTLEQMAKEYNLNIEDFLLKINDNLTKLSPEEYKSVCVALLYKSQNEFLQEHNLNMSNYKDVIYTDELVSITRTEAVKFCKKEHNLAREELAKYYNFDNYQELEDYLDSQRQTSWIKGSSFRNPEAKIIYEHLEHLDDIYYNQLYKMTGSSGIFPFAPFLPPPFGESSPQINFPIVTYEIDPQYEELLMKINCNYNILYSAYIENLNNNLGTYFTDDIQTQIMTSEINEISEKKQCDILSKFREFLENKQELDTPPTEDIPDIIESTLTAPTIAGACLSALLRSSKPLYTIYATKKVDKKVKFLNAIDLEVEKLQKEENNSYNNDEMIK